MAEIDITNNIPPIPAESARYIKRRFNVALTLIGMALQHIEECAGKSGMLYRATLDLEAALDGIFEVRHQFQRMRKECPRALYIDIVSRISACSGLLIQANFAVANKYDLHKKIGRSFSAIDLAGDELIDANKSIQKITGIRLNKVTGCVDWSKRACDWIATEATYMKQRPTEP